MITHSLPPSTQFLTPAIDAVATLDIATGDYIFSAEKIDVLDISTSWIYLIEKVSVGANIENSDFTTGRVLPMTIEFFYKKTGRNERAQHFPSVMNVNSVDFPIDLSNMFYSNNSGENTDVLQVKISGRIKQQINMIDIEELIFPIRFDIYQVIDNQFCDKVKKEWVG